MKSEKWKVKNENGKRKNQIKHRDPQYWRQPLVFFSFPSKRTHHSYHSSVFLFSAQIVLTIFLYISLFFLLLNSLFFFLLNRSYSPFFFFIIFFLLLLNSYSPFFLFIIFFLLLKSYSPCTHQSFFFLQVYSPFFFFISLIFFFFPNRTHHLLWIAAKQDPLKIYWNPFFFVFFSFP